MDKQIINLSVLVIIAVFSVCTGTVETKICWDSKWYNNSSPTNRSEYETLAQKLVDAICSPGPTVAAQCKDNRGEPFTAHKVDKFNEYEATCDVTNGLVCHPFANSTKTCPDFAIQYGCNCGGSTLRTTVSNNTGIVTTAPTTGNTGSSGTTQSSGSGGNSRLQRGGENAGDMGRPCMLLLLVCVVGKYLCFNK